MKITVDQIKELRDATGVSVMQCRKALEEAAGDFEKAKIILRKISKAAADKKMERSLGAGSVACYIHAGGAIGAMVELLCETDFVSNNEDFKSVAKDLAMHVAAFSPKYLKMEEVPAEDMAKARELFEEELKGKPENIKEKALQSKLEAFAGESVFLEQPFVKNPEIKIKEVVNQAIQKFGEKMEIGRFARFAVK